MLPWPPWLVPGAWPPDVPVPPVPPAAGARDATGREAGDAPAREAGDDPAPGVCAVPGVAGCALAGCVLAGCVLAGRVLAGRVLAGRACPGMAPANAVPSTAEAPVALAAIPSEIARVRPVSRLRWSSARCARDAPLTAPRCRDSP
ncbi:MAG: hypothetical protein ABSF03_13190 [Streptosporangiaceae bacterium]